MPPTLGTMAVSANRRLELSDPALPAFEPMLGPDAAAMVEAAWNNPGDRIAGTKPVQVNWRPGRSLTVQYEATIDTPGGTRKETIVATTGGELPPVLTLECEGARVAAWRLEDDPYLPGLRLLLDPVWCAAFLERCGIPAAEVETHLRAYRPGRRAVIEIRTSTSSLYAKLVPPDRVRRLQRRHERLSAVLPVPRSLGWEPNLGLVLLEALPGMTLRHALSSTTERLPATASIAALLDGLPEVSSRRAASPVVTALSHAELLHRLASDQAGVIDALSDAFAAIPEDDPLVPVHGDLYEGQLLVSGGRLTGLIDIDTAGMGARADDWATLIGHLDIWSTLGREPERTRAYARSILALADKQVDPGHLRTRVAAVILGLATGPFRVQMSNWPEETASRIARAERWQQSARSAAPG